MLYGLLDKLNLTGKPKSQMLKNYTQHAKKTIQPIHPDESQSFGTEIT